MNEKFEKLLVGYQQFRQKYAVGDQSIMQSLSDKGQQPEVMMLSCSDSRVDPGLILQCDPGELFVVRNVANIVPPYEKDTGHHGTSAGLEFGIRFLKVKYLILLGHSQCGGIQALAQRTTLGDNDFISSWMSIIDTQSSTPTSIDELAKLSLRQSYKHCLTFPWINEKVQQKELSIFLWFFDIKSGKLFMYSDKEEDYQPLEFKQYKELGLIE